MERYCYRCEKDVELRKAPNGNAQLCAACGAVIIHSANYLPPGTMLGGFKIVDELGRGGMGIVYRARQLNLERDVALKVLADDLANDNEFVSRFFKEARAAASLNHPNIVQVFDAGRSPEGISFFAMELIEGETLEAHIESHGKLSPGEALKVAVQIADALDYAWKSQKLTHGDIKPDNIILNNTGGAKLADLGLAKFVHDETSDDGIMATPLYAPPEVIKGEIELIGFHSDMYSFGATFYQMLAGVPPFPDNTPEVVFKQHLNDTPSSLYSYNDKLAPALVDICEQMLAKTPDRRPATWESVHTALKSVREPEISGKVFHTHQHSDVDFPERSRQMSILSLIVKSLVALVFILGVAVVAIFFVKQQELKKMSPSTAIANPEAVVEKWNEIKKEIPRLDPAVALRTVRDFIKECDDSVPDDTLVMRKKLEAKVSSILKTKQRRAEEQAKFEKRISEALASVKSMDIESSTTAIAVIENSYNQIHAILKKASDISYLKFPEGVKDTLTAAYKKLSDRLKEHKELMEKIRNEKIAEAQQEKLQGEKAQLAQEAEEVQSRIALNSTIDNYYTALSNFKKLKKLSTLKNGLIGWDQTSDVLAPKYTGRVDFLTQTIIPNAANIFRLIKSKELYFTNRKLPPGMCSDKIKYYTVRSFTDKGIKLEYNNNSKVTLGHTIPWSSLTRQQLALLSKERLLPVEGKLTEKEKNVILAFLLLFDNSSFSNILQNITGLGDRDKQMWRAINKDFAVSDQEIECITFFHSVNDAVSNGDYIEAAVLLQQLIDISKGTLFSSRYADILPHLRTELCKYTPLPLALEQVKKLLSSSGDATQKFNMAMVILARYSNSLSQLPAEDVSRLHKVRAKSLSELIHASGVKHITDNRIPFYYWSKEKQGAAQAFLDILIKNNRLNGRSAVKQIMNLSVAIDNGAWPTVKSIYSSKVHHDLSNIKSPDAIRSWMPSFIFAYGLADMQFGNGSARLGIHKLMEAEYAQYTTGVMAPLILSLLFEYDLLTRNTKFPLSVASRYHYKLLASYSAGFRVGLLGILACIENKQSKTTQLQFLSSRLGNVYRKQHEFYGDLVFVSAAEKLFKLKPLSQLEVKELISVQCSYSDSSARVLIAALARYHVMNGVSFADENLLIKSLERRVTPMVVSGDLWRKVQLLKMANNPYAGDIFRLTEAALKKNEICTTRFYPTLLMIRAGSEYLLGELTKEEVKSFLLHYFQASDLVSKHDLEDLDIVTTSDPSLIIARLFKEDQPEKAFQYGILGIMVHCKNPLIKSEIEKVMNINSSSLCWEEQYLIKQIRNWR